MREILWCGGRSLSLIALLGIASSAYSGTASLGGKVQWHDFFGNTQVAAGAVVRAVPQSGGLFISTTADISGNFLLGSLNQLQLPDSYTVIVTASNLSDLTINGVTTTSGVTSPLNPLMNPGVTLSGVVVNEQTHASESGAFIEARLQGVSGAGGVPTFVTYTAGDGSYLIEHLPLGSWLVRVAKAGWANQAQSGVDASAHFSKMWRNDGFPVFVDVGNLGGIEPTSSLVAVDVDADGDTDMAVGNRGAGNRIFLNDGSGNFSAGWTGPTGIATLGLAFMDVDNNGSPDLAVAAYDQPNRVYLNNGAGVFTESWNDGLFETSTSVDFGDVNADGFADLLIGNLNQPSKLYAGNGSGSFSLIWTGAAGMATRDAKLADMNNNGNLDILLGNEFQTNLLHTGNGAGIFGPGQQLGSALQSTYGIAPGHFNVDGVMDYFEVGFKDAIQIDGMSNKLYLGSGGGLFFDAGFPSGPNISADVDVGDLDGDGNLDLVVGNRYNAPNHIYRNDGAGGWSWSLLPLLLFTEAVSFIDFEGDGDLDLVEGNYGRPVVDFTLQRGGTLTGFLRNSLTGEGIGFGSVNITNGESTTRLGTAGSDGRYLHQNLDPAGYSLSASAPGFEPLSEIGVMIVNQQINNHDLVLSPSGRVTGLVTDSSGNTLAGVEVRLVRQFISGPQEVTVTSDGAGAFSFSFVSPGDHLAVALPTGLAQAGASLVMANGMPVHITLAAQTIVYSLEGKVAAQGDGEIIAGAMVQASPAGNTGGWAQGTTGPDGSFVLQGLAPGNYMLQAWHPSYLGGKSVQVTLPVGDPIQLFLPRKTALQSLDKVQAYPNPCRLSTAVGGVCKFAGLSIGAGIELFDLRGRLVRKLLAGINDGGSVNDGKSGRATWDGRDESGQVTAEGLYFYVVNGQDGSSRRGKLLLLK